MEDFVKARTIAKGKITRIETTINRYEQTNNFNIHELSSREAYLKSAFKDYSNAQNELENFDEDEYANDRPDVEEKFFSTMGRLTSLMQSKNIGGSSVSASQNSDAGLTVNSDQFNSSIKLPHVSIKTFLGDQTEWTSFKDLFDAVIHNNDRLSNIQKFLHLKSVLRGEPLNLIDKLPLSNENYQGAIDLLVKRYDNKTLMINAVVKSLLEIPVVTKSSGLQLRKFLTKTNQCLTILESNKLSPKQQLELICIYLLSNKLDGNTLEAYHLHVDKSELPTLKVFIDFLEERCKSFENITNKPNGIINHRNSDHKVNHFIRSESNIQCELCTDNHVIRQCPKFSDLTLSEKLKGIQQRKLCSNCLSSRHVTRQCMSRFRCRKCKGRHHSSIHNDNNNMQSPNSLLPVSNTEQIQDAPSALNSNGTVDNNNSSVVTNMVFRDHNSLLQREQKSQILLATAQVELFSSKGNRIIARALLDSGSQLSIITSQLADKLDLIRYKSLQKITGVAGHATASNDYVDLIINSRINKSRFTTSCVVLDKITFPLPNAFINRQCLKINPSYKLADPEFYKPGSIDILIGVDLYYEILSSGLVKLGKSLPTLQNSYLGWLVAGHAPIDTYTNSAVSLVVNVDDLIPKFWQLEELSANKLLSPEDKLSESIFTNTVKRLSNGRFEVDIPFVSNQESKLGTSYALARKRFLWLEKRLTRDKELFTSYKKFIDEYLALGHGKYVDDGLSNRYIMAHREVIKNESTTTKIRVVFDASMKTSNGLALNDITLKGYTVQPDLFDILCRFRTFKYVFSADIEKMYRQIIISEKHRHLQNILWRDDINKPLRCIELQTITYGTKSAPFLATRCLNHLAESESTNFPHASKAILENCYVDDVLAGANTVQQTIILRDELIDMLRSAGLELHKWCSNDSETIQNIPMNKRDSFDVDLDPDEVTNKVLGVAWNPKLDVFRIKVPPYDNTLPPTKRNILSFIAKMFDPLGLISPVVIIAKIIMQKIWISQIGRDELVPENLLEKWKSFVTQIPKLNRTVVPRWLFSCNDEAKIELHGFSDASMSAYGACIYIKAIYPNDTVSTALLCSKSRVAPLKVVSLPRLELCAALLLSRLIHKVIPILQLKISNVTLWTDSQIVLCWLNSTPSRWTTFVANRVSEIQELTGSHKWFHIRSQDNVADFISRGICPSKMNALKSWWEGPQLLLSTKLQSHSTGLEVLERIPEQKASLIVQVSEPLDNLFTKFSSLTRLQRVIAYCFRFLHNTRRQQESRSGTLTVKELRLAMHNIIKIIQQSHFRGDISDIVAGKKCSNSILVPLNPFVDDAGLLRVGGRLSRANLKFDHKFPLILPSKCHFTQLVIQREHQQLLHAGARLTLANIRLQYWPINGLNEVKLTIKNCVRCHRFKAQAAQQLMSSLPPERVNITHPFYNGGIDFGGPIMIPESRLRRSITTKSYIALFVCMATKAIHLELVSKLTTDAFILSLNRFIARKRKARNHI